MVAFKSRFWAAFDLPVRLEEDACFEGAGCFEGVPYFEAAACCETVFDADVSEADAVVDADTIADLAVSSACAEAAEPHAATLSPISPASEAATNRAEGGRDDAAPDPRARTARERKAEPDTPEPEAVRPSAPDVLPDWIPSPTASRNSLRRNHFTVLFVVLLMPPVLRLPSSADIRLPGQCASRAIPTLTLKPSRPNGIFLRYAADKACPDIGSLYRRPPPPSRRRDPIAFCDRSLAHPMLRPMKLSTAFSHAPRAAAPNEPKQSALPQKADAPAGVPHSPV